MNQAAVSVIVVSRHRPAALQRCIRALCQQDHQAFELIVVADPAAAHDVQALSLPIKVQAFDEANISAARNLGLGLASGQVVAFIDDDAVAEPSWLSRLVAPFADLSLCASTGFVRGRNGMSYQWRACEVDALGADHDLNITETTVIQGSPQRAVKTQGTNCAFRAAALRRIGGFDPAFRFYLDEADVNLRLAALGPTAIVPDAQVHHGYLASARRAANRVPLSLFDIAASTAIFLRRHSPDTDFAAAFDRLERREVARIQAHCRAGRLDEGRGKNLLRSLQEGWSAGRHAHLPPLPPLADGQTTFLRLASLGPARGQVLAGRFWQKRALLAKARKNVDPAIVTVICLSPTARPHRVAYQPEGFWLQTGGVFGKSERDGAWLQLKGFHARISDEMRRIAGHRPIE